MIYIANEKTIRILQNRGIFEIKKVKTVNGNDYWNIEPEPKEIMYLPTGIVWFEGEFLFSDEAHRFWFDKGRDQNIIAALKRNGYLFYGEDDGNSSSVWSNIVPDLDLKHREYMILKDGTIISHHGTGLRLGK